MECGSAWNALKIYDTCQTSNEFIVLEYRFNIVMARINVFERKKGSRQVAQSTFWLLLRVSAK